MTKKARLYSTETCVNCKAAHTLLTLKGYEVEYWVIGKDVSKDDFWAEHPSVRGVPYVILDTGNKFEGLNNLRKYLM